MVTTNNKNFYKYVENIEIMDMKIIQTCQEVGTHRIYGLILGK